MAEDGAPSPAPGSVVHVELYSEAPEETRAFYEQAFGWTFETDEATGYTSFRAPSAPHGGLLEPPDEGFVPPATLVYLATDDLAPQLEALERAGGKLALPGYEVPGVGAFAVFQAPGGIVQGLWERAGGYPAPEPPAETPPTGSIIHVELHSDNAGGTRRFFTDLFGWSFHEVPDTDVPYHIATLPSPPDGGLIERQEGPFSPPATLLYLRVEEVNQALSEVYRAGGTVLGERYEIEDFGAFGIFQAPGGIVQAVWEALG